MYLPSDALERDSVILPHLRSVVGNIEILKPYTRYRIGKINFQTAMPHIHSVETYGLKFEFAKKSLSLISDTRYFSELADVYQADRIVINVVFYEPRQGVDHLSIVDARKIIEKINL